MRWLKSGSFGFAEGLASCVGAKPNVLFVRWALCMLPNAFIYEQSVHVTSQNYTILHHKKSNGDLIFCIRLVLNTGIYFCGFAITISHYFLCVSSLMQRNGFVHPKLQWEGSPTEIPTLFFRRI